MSTFHKNAYISWLPSTILLLKRNQLIYSLISHNVHLGIKPPQKHHHLFFPSPLLNLQTFKVSFFRYPPPHYILFFCEPTLKIRFFSEPPYVIFLIMSSLPTALFLENVIGDSTPQQKWRGLHYVFLTYSTHLEPQKLVIFGLQLCPINHKNSRS